MVAFHRLARLFMTILTLAVVASPSVALAVPDPYEPAKIKYYALLDDSTRNRDHDQWRRVAQLFSQAQKKAPTGARADDALYMAGLCYERAHRLHGEDGYIPESLAYYDKLYTAYPGSPLADDGLFRSARIAESRGNVSLAKKKYKIILRSYKSGDMLELARGRLGQLGRKVQIMGVRHFSGPNYTRFVVDLDGLSPYQAKALPANGAAGKPPRVYVDLQNTTLPKTMPKETAVGDGAVSRVRMGQFDPDTVRVVLDLSFDADYRVFPLLAPARMVIDIYKAETPSRSHSPTKNDLVAQIINRNRKEVLREARASRTTPKSTTGASAGELLTGKLRIVIDAGHGGKDPGAVGVGRLKEKDLTLAIARKLAVKLKNRLDCEVKLTRSTDTYLSLSRRTAMANAFGADIFISIHANASRSKSARGIETYYLDRSSDRSARRVAALENKTSEAGVRETEQILADVLLNMKLPESKRLADNVQKALTKHVAKKHGAVRDLGVKRAPFYVLTGAIMPSVLVETGFITNKAEAKRLKSNAYQDTVADSICAGIVEYSNGI